VFRGLIAAGDWLTRALDIQGYRLDDVKGVSTDFLLPFLNQAAMAGKFAVGEFFDGNIGFIQGWMNSMQHRSSAFDFPLRFKLQTMCNHPESFNMADLDHAGLTGADPLGSVTFVENHDTDLNSPIVRNKMLAYAYILTSEGYPCIFYRDYSTDTRCFGLKPEIDRLLWIHERLAQGPTQQRWKDWGVFAFERLGREPLVVALNKDAGTSRKITIQTAFPADTSLQDFTGHGPPLRTDAQGNLTLTVAENANGLGYVCYARPAQIAPFDAKAIPVSQEYEGSSDLDIRPAVGTESVTICRVFVQAQQAIESELFFDTSHWTSATAVQLDLHGPDDAKVAGRRYDLSTAQGAPLSFKAQQRGFHAFRIQSGSAPVSNPAPSFKLRVKYVAPQTL